MYHDYELLQSELSDGEALELVLKQVADTQRMIERQKELRARQQLPPDSNVAALSMFLDKYVSYLNETRQAKLKKLPLLTPPSLPVSLAGSELRQ